MALKDDLKLVVEQYKAVAGTLDHNRALFDIFEGDLLTHVLRDLEAELSENAFKQAKPRVAPINVLKRVIDKLSKIYAKPPQRKIDKSVKKDQDLLAFYEEAFDVNNVMASANEFFNLFKNCMVEPYLEAGKPKLRVIPADRFFVLSTDPVNPLKPTHYTKIMGKIGSSLGEDRVLMYTYTKDEFLAHDQKGEVVDEVMARADIAALGGRNPYGRIPGVYINRSLYDLIPKRDTDTLSMTKLIAILISDLNYAAKFQSFSLIYGIDLDEEGIKFAPNAFMRFKSDPNRPESKPEIGSIKPEVDIDKVLSLIKAEMSLWMQSRNIKPGAMGDLSVENMASGIAKAIDEMDTSEDRQKQVSYFVRAEAELWDLVVNAMHPIWFRQPDFEQRIAFTPGVKIKTEFPEQRAIVDSSKAISDQKEKISMRIQSRRGALQELYPDWEEEQIDKKLAEVDEELTVDMGDGLLEDPEQDQVSEGEEGSSGKQPALEMAKEE